MSFKNLATYHELETNGYHTLAEMCKRRLSTGEPNTAPLPRSQRRPVPMEFKNKDGQIMSLEAFAKYVGVTPHTIKELVRRYDGDCDKIIDNHGYNAHSKRAPKRRKK